MSPRAGASEPSCRRRTARRHRAARSRRRHRAPAVKVDMHGRRLIVLFFDLSSMQPEEVKRAVGLGARLRREETVARRPHRDRVVLHLAADRPGLHRGSRAAGRGDRRVRRRQRGRLRRRRERRRRGHAGQRQHVHRRRHRVQHLQYRSAARRAADAGRRARRDRAEEVGHLFQQRHEPAGNRQPGPAAPHGRSRQPRQRVDLRGGHARPAGDGARRRCDAGQPARHVARSPARRRETSSAVWRRPRTR